MRRSAASMRKAVRAESEAGALWGSGAASFPRLGCHLTRRVARSRPVAAGRDRWRYIATKDHAAGRRYPRTECSKKSFEVLIFVEPGEFDVNSLMLERSKSASA